MSQRPTIFQNPSTEAFLPPESELAERFVRSSGPGGQHVNRTETAVQLRFDARNSVWLRADVLERLLVLAGQRADQHGVISIESSQHRSQIRNRQDARVRLAELIERAHHKPKPRRATRPSTGQRRKRLDQKKRRSQALNLRRKPDPSKD